MLAKLEAALAGRKADVVVSDMAPNLSGIESADAARIAHLVELAVDFAQHHLKPEGALVSKVFHGSGYSELVKLFKEHFPGRQASETQGLARQVVRDLPGGHGPEDQAASNVRCAAHPRAALWTA